MIVCHYFSGPCYVSKKNSSHKEAKKVVRAQIKTYFEELVQNLRFLLRRKSGTSEDVEEVKDKSTFTFQVDFFKK